MLWLILLFSLFFSETYYYRGQVSLHSTVWGYLPKKLSNKHFRGNLKMSQINQCRIMLTASSVKLKGHNL